MIIRPYTPDDVETLAALYRDSVTGLGATAYTPEQIAVWAAFADDLPKFRKFLSQGYTHIAEVDGVLVAFCQRHPEDHIALLYTATRFARRGFATAVYRAIEAHARECNQTVLTTDASKLSRPFFEKEGYTVCRTEQSFREGISFERFQMNKPLDAVASRSVTP